MKKHFVTDSAEPTTTDTQQRFKSDWLKNYATKSKCKAGHFISHRSGFTPSGCMNEAGQACNPIPNALLLDKSNVRINGNPLLHKIMCFGTAIIPNGSVPNVCEIEGNSIFAAVQKNGSENEETERDGLQVITLARDYQVSGGVVREAQPNVWTHSGITFGRLTTKERVFYTIEPQWVGNARNISCIPEGEYYIKEHNSTRFGECVKVFDIDRKSEVSGREHILFHYGNYVDETEGCILVGYALARTPQSERRHGDFMLAPPTKEAVKVFREIVGNSGAILKIISGKTNAIKNIIM